MFAVLALIAAAIAVLLHVIKQDPHAQWWLFAISLILICAHGIWPFYPWRRVPPQQ
jgi:hypothetical protein